VQLSYRQLEAILTAYLNVHPDKVGTFRSRLKQLQRLEFPQGVNIGRGVRMTYSADHILQLATAFEVIGAGLAAKAATDLVTKHWSAFQTAFARAHSRMGYGSEPETFVCIAGRGPVEPERKDLDAVTVHDLTSLTEQVLCFPRPDAPSRAGMILIRADYLLERLLRLVRDVGQVTGARWSPEFSQWKDKREKSHPLWDYSDGGPQVPF
jgi:hypothetical protein